MDPEPTPAERAAAADLERGGIRYVPPSDHLPFYDDAGSATIESRLKPGSAGFIIPMAPQPWWRRLLHRLRLWKIKVPVYPVTVTDVFKSPDD